MFPTSDRNMKRIALLVLASTVALLALTIARSPARAAPPAQSQVYDVWPGKPPGEIGNIGAEKFWDKRPDGTPIPDVGGKPVKWLTNVSKPTITVYRRQETRTRAHPC